MVTVKCDTAFKKLMMARCYDAFEQAGFTRFRLREIDWPLHNGFHAWVGLATGLYPDRLEIHPNIGVHVVPIEKMCTDLDKGRYKTKYDRGVATYAITLGEIDGAKDEFAFAFAPDQTEGFVRSEIERLVDLYMTIGLDFAQSLASYETLLPRLSRRVRWLGGYPQRVACCLYMMERKAEARKFVEEFLPDHRDIFEGFALPFLKKLEAEGL